MLLSVMVFIAATEKQTKTSEENKGVEIKQKATPTEKLVLKIVREQSDSKFRKTPGTSGRDSL